jgi:nucleoside-diphosphate-sugar epimerase
MRSRRPEPGGRTLAERLARVLVTGATGLIGRHAPAALAAQGFEVHATARAPAPGAAAGVSAWHARDLFEAGAAAELIEAVRPSHLLHLAWSTQPGEFFESELNDRWLEASEALLDAFTDAGGERFVGAGSCAEYDWSAPAPFSEAGTPLRPATRYGRAKAALRELAEARAADGGPAVAWGRIFLLHGEHEDPARLVPSIVCALLEGRTAASGPPERRLDLLHAADVAGGLAALTAATVTGAVNVASGDAVGVGELLERLGALTGRSDLLAPGALPGRAGEPDALVADVSRLTGEVGWRPSLDLDAGLERSVRWWRDRLD